MQLTHACPVDCLYKQIPEDRFWLETEKTGSGQSSFITGRMPLEEKYEIGNILKDVFKG